MTEPLAGRPLAGRTVGVTADRKADELIGLLRRRGAEVLHGPAMRTVMVPDDERLLAESRRLLDAGPDVVVLTTGMGFRGWRDALAGWGLGERFDAACAAARLLVRGPKARGAVHAAGLTEEWSAPSETNAEILDYLRGGDPGTASLRGLRIAVQQHGKPMPEFADALRAAGAEVFEVCVYRWAPPVDPAPLDALIEATVAGRVHALTFTSAPAADGLLTRAAELDRQHDLLDALRDGVLVVCVGPVTAAPLAALGVPDVRPQRARTAALVRTLTEHLGAGGDTPDGEPDDERA